jgi:hypothetical protein
LIWPTAQAAFTRYASAGRTLPAAVKYMSYVTLAAGILAFLSWPMGTAQGVVPLLAGTVAVGGFALAAYLAVQAFVRKKPVAFWIAPVAGAGIVGLVMWLAMVGDDDYAFYAGVGMTLANIPFLVDAWQRFRSAKP